MQKHYRVIIVGGGAAGLISAVELTRGKNSFSGSDILILEKTDRLGKKLVVTGNGQGNLSNMSISTENYYGDKNFVYESVNNITQTDICKYFKGLGLTTTTDVQGRIYPLSRQASAVSDILRAHIAQAECNVVLNAEVDKIVKIGDNFKVSVKNTDYFGERVILAVGGACGKQFGTDGSSYRLAESLGHKKTKLYPSLVQIKTELDKIRGLKGIKEYVRLTAYDGEMPLKTAEGDLLFTDYGISGSAVFQVSGHLTKAVKPNVKVEFLPDYSESQAVEILQNAGKNSPLYTENAFSGIINKRVGQAVIKSASGRNYYALASALKNFRLTVKGSLGFDYAQVTKGGIASVDVDEKTYESRLARNMYLVGEMLDVDGDCGGYNLTFAFVSGILSARSIKLTRGEL